MLKTRPFTVSSLRHMINHLKLKLPEKGGREQETSDFISMFYINEFLLRQNIVMQYSHKMVRPYIVYSPKW